MRVNRKPLYIAISACAVVSFLLIWAWVVKAKTHAAAAVRASTATQATPATSALKSLDKQWDQAKAPAAPAAAPAATQPVVRQQQMLGTFPIGQAQRQQAMPRFMDPAAFGIGQSAGLASFVQPAVAAQKTTSEDEERAAMDSPLVSQAGTGVATTSPPGSAGYQQPSVGLPQQRQRAAEEEDEEDAYTKQNLQMSKKNFAGIDKDTHVPILALKGHNLPYVIRAGWDIPAILEQKAISDLPGELRARVRQNVYDTDTGKYLLIAQNSILTGKYNSDVAYAQNRLQINWDRLEMLGVPTIFLNHMNGQDNDGGTGLNGNVNNHYKRLIGFAVLSSVFAAGIEVSQNPAGNASGYPTTGQLAAAAVGQQMGQFGQRVTQKNLNIPPTVTIPAGTHFNVRVDRDIVFAAPFGQ